MKVPGLSCTRTTRTDARRMHRSTKLYAYNFRGGPALSDSRSPKGGTCAVSSAEAAQTAESIPMREVYAARHIA